MSTLRKRKSSENEQETEPNLIEEKQIGNESVRVLKLNSAVALSLGVLIGSICGGPWLQDLVDLARGYRWNYVDRCIMETPESNGYGVDFCRTPVDCSSCQNVDKIDEISVENLSVDLFEGRYAYTSRPLIVRNASINWDLMEVLNYHWLKDIYLSDPDLVDKTGDECWFNRYKSLDIRNLRGVFKLSEARVTKLSGKPWYVGWAVCQEKVAEEIFSLFERPTFINPDSTPPRKPWIFIGTPGNGAHLHIDNVDLSSWQAQVQGEKTWYLRAPPECYLSCPNKIMEATLYPGDIIVINTNEWFHATKVILAHTPKFI